MHFSTRTVRRSMFTLNTSFYFKGDRFYRKVHINIHELKNILQHYEKHMTVTEKRNVHEIRVHSTLFTLTSVLIFSILFSIHFLRCH